MPHSGVKANWFYMLYKNTVAPATLELLNKLKVDIVLHRYPYLQKVETIEGIRLASVPDIIAMKLNAITRRSTKKDFFDIAELLNDYTLKAMLGFFGNKYAATDIGFVVRSLTYFDEAEATKNPIMLNSMEWEQVKQKIRKAVQEYWNE